MARAPQQWEPGSEGQVGRKGPDGHSLGTVRCPCEVRVKSWFPGTSDGTVFGGRAFKHTT